MIEAFFAKNRYYLAGELISFRTGENARSANHYRDVFGRRRGLQALQDLESAHARHVEIEEDQLGLLFTRFLKSVVSVISLADEERCVAQLAFP